METYILLSRMTTTAAQDLAAFEELNERVTQRLEEEGVEVHWLAHYTVLGPYDYIDIFEARDNEEAAKVALVIRSFGHAVTEVWPAVPWDRFAEIAGTKSRVRRFPRKKKDDDEEEKKKKEEAA